MDRVPWREHPDWRERLEAMRQEYAKKQILRMIRCPNGRMHRWDGDGRCKSCHHFATDLVDDALEGK